MMSNCDLGVQWPDHGKFLPLWVGMHLKTRGVLLLKLGNLMPSYKEIMNMCLWGTCICMHSWFIWVVGCIVVVSVFAKPLVLGPLGRVSGGSFESYRSEWLPSITAKPRLCHTAFPLCSTFYLPACLLCLCFFVFLCLCLCLWLPNITVLPRHRVPFVFNILPTYLLCLCLCSSLLHLCLLDLEPFWFVNWVEMYL